MFARQLVIDTPQRPDDVRAAFRSAVADVDRAAEVFAMLLPFAGGDGPTPDLVGTVGAPAFRLRVVWPSSWFNRHGPIEVLGDVASTATGSRVTLLIRRPRWYVVLSSGMALGALALMVSAALEGEVTGVFPLALVTGVAALGEAMRYSGDTGAVEAALRRVVQPEGRGRFVWD